MNIQYRLIICIAAMLGTSIACFNARELPPGKMQVVNLRTSIVKKINPDAYGVNTQTAAGPSWDDPKFMDLIKQLSPGNMRYPGGTIGNYMNWQTGQYMEQDLRDPEKIAPKIPIKGITGTNIINTYRLEEFKNGIKASGATPIFMVNMLTDTLGNTKKMLAHAVELGLKVKYIELGNELYLSFHNGGNAQTGILGDYTTPFHFPTAKSYAEEAQRWVRELKAIYPDAEFAYNAVIDKPKELWFNSSPRTVEWNNVMKNSDIGADAVILHLYTSVNGSKCGEDALCRSLNEVADFKRFVEIEFPGINVWVTEYNISAAKMENGNYRNPFVGQWIHGINTLLMTTELLLIPQVELMSFHNIAAGVTAALVYEQATKIPLFQGSAESVTAQPLTFSAGGYTLSLLGSAMSGAEQVQRLITNTEGKIKCESGEIESIYGYLFEGQHRRALIVNMSKEDRYLNPDIGEVRAKNMVQCYAESLNTIINSRDKLINNQIEIQGDQIVLKPYSVSVLYY